MYIIHIFFKLNLNLIKSMEHLLSVGLEKHLVESIAENLNFK